MRLPSATRPLARSTRASPAPPRAAAGGGDGPNDTPMPTPRVPRRRRRRSSNKEDDGKLSLDTFNPYAMGRKSR